MNQASGIVVTGHGVASGRAADPRFPAGTIALQAPLFRARGVDLAALIGAEPVMGTINVDLAPAVPRVLAPEIELRDVVWSPVMPAENFWLFRATVDVPGSLHHALIYMPDPATKPEHHQPGSVIEIIAAHTGGLSGGQKLRISADPSYIRFALPPLTL
ncbi:hypothetical protein [Sphingomonas sp.]|uniref:hypothetical protein n=1 Tax=Sphingomonas sp. TaxID=28214 RepID=UPI003AFFAF6F